MPLKIDRCIATPSRVFIFFSESLFCDGSGTETSADNKKNYLIFQPPSPGSLGADNFKAVSYSADRFLVTIDLDIQGAQVQLPRGHLIVVQAQNVVSDGDKTRIGNGGNDFASARVNGAEASGNGFVDEAVEDLAAYPVLTEEVGYPPSPIVSGGGTPATSPAQASLGGAVEGTLRQLLGWKPNSGDPKGFVGALNASFQCSMLEGRTDCTWVPRTYAVQTDLSGGITGAQASLYSRTKGAVDQALPLLDGLYSLDEEAKPENIAALKSVARTQLTALVSELGIPGGPRVQRVNQLFGLLLGGPLRPGPQTQYDPAFWQNPQNAQAGETLTTNPDQFDPTGTLGNLRDEMGLSLLPGQSLVNTVEDEQDVTNFRIIGDYVTSLAQSWLNNLPFFSIPTATGPAPFFGTLLVLLSRQLSVIAEKVNEVRFTLDSVFIGPSERQTLRIDFQKDADGNQFPSIFLEDLLSWVEAFATQEGPQLIQEGGKYAVGASFRTTARTVLSMIQNLPRNSKTSPGVPGGFFTLRVQRSLQDLTDQLQQLSSLTSKTSYVITPEPQAHLNRVPPNGRRLQ